MIRVTPGSVFAILLIGILATPLQAALSDQPDAPILPQPTLDYLPQDVVRIVIEALSTNDQPFLDAGIATTFAFASPANKVNTGPLSRFAGMVKNNVYGIMIDHVKSAFSELVMVEMNAYQMVKLTGERGKQVVFAFRLSKQLDGKFAGMWMTDAVWPISKNKVPEQSF